MATTVIGPGGSGSPVVGGGTGAAVVAKVDLTGQSANIAYTPFYTVPANAGGTYRFCAYTVVTQAATTSSSLPYAVAQFTDLDTNIVANGTISNTSAGNTAGTTHGLNNAVGAGEIIVQVKGGTSIGYLTTGYASAGATPMLYAVHIKVEYLG
jgi:hypothetical protein